MRLDPNFANTTLTNHNGLTPVTPREALWYKDEQTGRVIILLFPKKVILTELESLVWESIDGFNTVTDIANKLNSNTKSTSRFDEKSIVTAVLEQFQCKKLIKLRDLKKGFWCDSSDKSKANDEYLDISKKMPDGLTDLVLIAPPKSLRTFSQGKVSLAPPIGLLYVASNLLANGFSVKILDLADKQEVSKDRFFEYLDQNKPHVVGISVWTEFYENALEIAQAVREYDAKIAIVFGGPHATFMAEECFKDSDCVDAVCRHEGEYTMVELMSFYKYKKNSLADILGITYRDPVTGAIKRNPNRPFIANLDALQFPARHLIDLSKYIKPMFLITSRGCHGKCIFCAGTTMGRQYRFRTPINVIQEVNGLITEYEPEEFYFVDDTFTARPERSCEICALLKDLNIKWFCESRVDIAERELFKLFHETGCRYIQFGVESGSQPVLDAIKKEITLNQVENAVRLATEAGIKVACSFIIGHFVDTEETMQETIEFMRYLRDQYDVALFCGPNILFPGTYQYAHMDILGLKPQIKAWGANIMGFTITPTKNITTDKLRRYVYEAAEISLPTIMNLARGKYSSLANFE